MATISIDRVSDAVKPAGLATGSKPTEAEMLRLFTAELLSLLKLIQEHISDSRMSPCVKWSMGTLALISDNVSEVYPSAVKRALQMAEATPLSKK